MLGHVIVLLVDITIQLNKRNYYTRYITYDKI